MKRVAVVVILVMAAAVLGLWRSQGGVREGLSGQSVLRAAIRKARHATNSARVSSCNRAHAWKCKASTESSRSSPQIPGLLKYTWYARRKTVIHWAVVK